MKGKLHKIDAAQNQHPSGSPREHTDLSAVKDREDDSVALSGRALRNWLLIANLSAWIAIVVAIKLLFF